MTVFVSLYACTCISSSFLTPLSLSFSPPPLTLLYTFRKSEAVSLDSPGAPPEKKVLLEPSPAVQTLTSSIADVKAVTKEPPAVRKIIKLKRPGRTAPPIV